MIKRSNPAVGYMAEEVFKTYAFTQTIKAGNTLYLSGIAPLKGDLKNLELVGEGNMRAQTEWILEVLKRCLAAEGATVRNWVAQTVYVTSIAEFVKAAEVFNQFFGEHTPTSTLVEVKGLFHPQQMIEINGIAVLD
jgi:2-iminobutanoate/2-iminopropanoate deaminase